MLRDYNWGAIAAVGFPVGLVVVFLGLVLLTGSVSDAGGLVGISIICTAGLALIFWVPLCTGTGMLVTFLAIAAYRQLAGRTAAPLEPVDRFVDTSPTDTTASSRNAYHQAVADYIRKARAKGYSDSQIDTRLAARGWQPADIEQARVLLMANSAR